MDRQISPRGDQLVLAFGHKVGGEFATNPMSGLRANQGDTANQVDPRSVVNPKQGRQLLAAVTYAGRQPGWYDYPRLRDQACSRGVRSFRRIASITCRWLRHRPPLLPALRGQ